MVHAVFLRLLKLALLLLLDLEETEAKSFDQSNVLMVMHTVRVVESNSMGIGAEGFITCLWLII